MPEYPLIEVCISIGTQAFFGEALPDTGYDGAIIVPEAIAVEIDASPERRVLTVADGFRHAVDSWRGELSMEHKTFKVRINALGDQFIIGREVLDQVEICFRFGKTVSLRFTPEE